MKPKPFYQSKTFWFNLLYLLVAFATLFGFDQFQPNKTWLETAVVTVAVGNLILRFLTKDPIG